MRLDEVKEGCFRVIKCKSERLMKIGLIKGKKITVLLNRRYLVVLIDNAKFVIDKKLARSIEVD